MKKLILLLLVLFSSNIFSQSGWELIYSGNSSISQIFKDISFSNEQTGWLLCNNNIKRTTNAGQSWSTFNPAHLNNTLSCFYMYNENLGWVFEDRFVNLTSDGGITWQVLDTSVAAPRSVSFINILTGWVCGAGGMIKKTTNGGYNWINIPSGVTDNLNAISFYDENKGVCAGDWGKVLSTTNGGNSWNTFIDPYLGFFYFSKYRTDQIAFVCGNGSNIYRTSNNGLNWSLVYVNASVISSIRFTTTGTAYAFGSPGDLFNSTNTGISWNRMQPNGLNPRIYGASITPGNSIWAAADSGLIFRSTNLGSSWDEIFREYITKENLNSVYFINNLSGYACGNRGVLIKTGNGGVNWSHTGFNYPNILKSVKFLNDNTGYLCGGNGILDGVIYKTTNFGSGWINVYQDTSQLNAVSFINTNTGWAAGYSGVILKTTNAGASWIKTRYQTGIINDISFVNDQTGFICTNGIIKSTNSGLNWYQVSSNSANAVQVFGNNVFALTLSNNNRYFSKSTDLGENWTHLQTGNGANVSLFFVNSETGWISSGSTIRKTTNGGINWVIQQLPANSISMNSVFFRDQNYGWVVGMYGGIMRTLTGGIGITAISTEIPAEYNLYQNYPNPFNPSTKVKFNIPLSRGVSAGRGVLLKIYDVLGKEVALLVNEVLKPGTYEIEWNAENYPSGVYFYSLITNEFTQTRKLVVLK